MWEAARIWSKLNLSRVGTSEQQQQQLATFWEEKRESASGQTACCAPVAYRVPFITGNLKLTWLRACNLSPVNFFLLPFTSSSSSSTHHAFFFREEKIWGNDAWREALLDNRQLIIVPDLQNAVRKCVDTVKVLVISFTQKKILLELSRRRRRVGILKFS